MAMITDYPDEINCMMNSKDTLIDHVLMKRKKEETYHLPKSIVLTAGEQTKLKSFYTWCYAFVDKTDLLSREIIEYISYYYRAYSHSIKKAKPTTAKMIMKDDGDVGVVDDLELVATTCLYIAIKVNSINPPIDVDSFLKIIGAQMDIKQLSLMEINILSKLNWLVNPPTSYSFVREYFDILSWSRGRNFPENRTLYKLTKYIIEVSMLDVKFSSMYKPSTIAYCATKISLQRLRKESSTISTHLENHNIEDIHEIIQLDRKEIRLALKKMCNIYDSVAHRIRESKRKDQSGNGNTLQFKPTFALMRSYGKKPKRMKVTP